MNWKSVALAAALLLAVSGCSSSGGSDTSGPIVIGASMPLSGATPLPQIADGYKAAVAEINDKGGLSVGGKKRKVELKILDNRSDSTTMAQQVRSLVLQDKASVLLGSCCQQNIDLATQASALKVPVIMGALPIDLLPPGKNYAWNGFQALGDAATAFFDLARGLQTNKKVVIVSNNDAQGTATIDAWSKATKANGMTVATTSAVPGGTTDFSNVVSKAKASDAQVLVAAMSPPDCFSLWKQMKSLGYTPKIAVGLQCAQTPGWAALGELGDGTVAVQNWTKSAGLPEADKIVANFEKKYPNPSDLSIVPIGYELVEIAAAAIEKANSADPMKINAAMSSIKIDTALGPVDFSSGNTSRTPTYLSQWNGGTISQVYPSTPGSTKLAAPVAGLQ